MLENLHNINKYLLNYMNSFAENDFIKQIIFIFADAPIFFLPIFLVSYWIYYTYKKDINLDEKFSNKRNLLFIFYGVIFSIITSITIQQFVNIDRPEQHLTNSANLILNHIPDASFPSDHATVSFAFLAGLFLAGYKKTGYTFAVFVIIMNLSRIMAGVHWPFDILAGAIIGTIVSCITFKVLRNCKYSKSFDNFVIKTMNYIKM